MTHTAKRAKGSTFIVNVNLKRVRNSGEKLRGQGNVQAPDYDFTGKRALLVEDNEVNIEITRNILLHKNLQVDVAVNGEEGVTHFLSHEPGYYDVILDGYPDAGHGRTDGDQKDPGIRT